MAAGRGSIATSSRVSCIRLTTDATPTTKPIPSFGSRRTVPGIRAEILRRRPRRDARTVVGRPLALPDATSAVVRSLAADRCAALSQVSFPGAADRYQAGRGRGPVEPQDGWNAAREVCSLPPCGGGLGRGVAATAVFAGLTPLPSPPPQGGREPTARASRLSARLRR